MLFALTVVMVLLAAAETFVLWQIRRRHMQRWLGTYLLRPRPRLSAGSPREVHLLLCVADHYEPKAESASKEMGLARVQHWVEAYPRLFGSFRDSDGRTPQHTFFFPVEEYEPEYLDLLSSLCRRGFGEVEIHLHHDRDTAAGLRRQLVDFRDLLASRHGLLSRHRHSGELGYAFIHGNWALCNCDPSGRNCGVNEELTVLRETGCFVDMTFPSAPHPTQPPKINSIYYACDRPSHSASHETGVDAGVAPPPDGGLLLVQGPLLLDWQRPKWGILPRLENGCLQRSQPPVAHRIDLWLRAGVQVPTRPDWFFVKLHAHGAPEDAHGTLLGEPMVRFHEELARRARANAHFHFHYVSAREMFNLVKAAEAGRRESVDDLRDFVYLPNLPSDRVESQADRSGLAPTSSSQHDR